MTTRSAPVERLRGGFDGVVAKAVDAGVYLPLGLYDRARDELTGLDAKRLRKTFDGLIVDFIGRGEDRVQPLERRLRRDARKARAGVNEKVAGANQTTQRATKTTAQHPKPARKPAKKTTARAKKTTSG